MGAVRGLTIKQGAEANGSSGTWSGVLISNLLVKDPSPFNRLNLSLSSTNEPKPEPQVPTP